MTRELQGVKRRHRLLALIIIPLFFVGLVLPIKSSSTDKPPDAFNQFLDNRDEDIWQVVGDDCGKPNQEVVRKVYEELEQGFKTYQKIPKIALLKKEFSGRLKIDFLHFKYVEPTTADHPLIIILFTKPCGSGPSRKGFSSYYVKRHIIYFPALNMSAIWQNAALFHELYHAYVGQRHSPSAHTTRLSDTGTDEELQAHFIESTIVDSAVNGRYRKAIKTIVNNKNAETLEDFYNQITTVDLESIDSLFPRASFLEVSMRVFNYQLDLGNQWLIRHFSGVKLRTKKRNNYRTLAPGPPPFKFKYFTRSTPSFLCSLVEPHGLTQPS